jgi:hypothetical protein
MLDDSLHFRRSDDMRLVIAFLLLAIFALPASAAGSQDLAEAPGAYAPVPEDCQVDPRAVDETLALIRGDDPVDQEPAETNAQPDDERGPGETSLKDHVTATIHELAACIGAGDLGRTLALVTDGYIKRLTSAPSERIQEDLLLNSVWNMHGQFFTGDETWRDSMTSFLEASRGATPMPSGAGPGAILGIPAIWEVGAGRVAAVFSMEGLACFMRCDYAVILRQDEASTRYLIDDAIEIFDLADIPSG